MVFLLLNSKCKGITNYSIESGFTKTLERLKSTCVLQYPCDFFTLPGLVPVTGVIPSFRTMNVLSFRLLIICFWTLNLACLLSHKMWL